MLVSAVSKGGFGGGIGLLSVPLMSLVMPPASAAAIILPLLLLMDAIGVWVYRRHWDRAALVVMLPAAMLGIALGTAAFGLLSDDAVRLLLGIVSVLFAGNWLGGGTQRLQPVRPRPWLGALCGGLAGFTSTLAHAGGPPATLYLLPLRLDKTVFVGTMTMLFAAINLAKLPPYLGLGLFSAEVLGMCAVMAPLAALGMMLGIWLHRRVADSAFYRLCYAMVVIAGIKLVWDGIT